MRDILRHIGKAVFFSSHRDSYLMALFSVYFDASGNKRETTLTVVGFVSSVKKWDQFNTHWSAVLKREGIKSMHMTDFVSSVGEFSSWKGQSDRRRAFIADLADCIRRYTKAGFGSSVVIEDYNLMDRRFVLHENVGQPYTLCVRSCLGGLRKWATTKRAKLEDILVFVEQGDEDQAELINAARVDGVKVVPLFKQDVIAFEAADVASWKFRTAIHNAEHAPLATLQDAKNILRSLEPVQALVQKNGVFNRDALAVVCKKGNIPRR